MITTYEDDIIFIATHVNYKVAQRQSGNFLNRVNDWTRTLDLRLNADKTLTTLFTPDVSEYSNNLYIRLEGRVLKRRRIQRF